MSEVVDELPTYKSGPTQFKIKKKETEDNHKRTETPSIHRREEKPTRVYKCKYISKKDKTKHCPFETSYKAALREHEKTHTLKDKADLFESDILTVEIPKGNIREWSAEHQMYMYSQPVKLPDGYTILEKSRNAVSREFDSPNMIAPQIMPFYEYTLVKDKKISGHTSRKKGASK